MHLRTAAVLTLILATGACARATSTGFPPPVRPGVLVATDFETTFAALQGMLESRGMPLLVEDHRFGNLITEWIEWGPGEVNLPAMAECDLGENDRVYNARGRFAFEVRPRANRAQVTIISHFQVEAHPGFDESDRGYVDCRSSGEWERVVADALTQRQVVR